MSNLEKQKSDTIELRYIKYKGRIQELFSESQDKGFKKEAFEYNDIFVETYSMTLFSYIAGKIDAIIEERDLKDEEENIKYGLSKSIRKFDVDTVSCIDDAFEKLRARSCSMIPFAKDYIDRWQMYNTLFK